MRNRLLDWRRAFSTALGSAACLGSLVSFACSGHALRGGPPLVHRAAASACTQARPAGNPSSPASLSGPPCYAQTVGGECKADTDCTAGVNGRCECGPNGATNFGVDACTYDECASDSDCHGGVCSCRGDALRASAFDNQVCLPPGNCQVDSDCGQGGYCSPSRDPSKACNDTWSGYFCHTSSDDCLDNSDCSGKDEYCVYGGGHWACALITCAPDG